MAVKALGLGIHMDTAKYRRQTRHRNDPAEVKCDIVAISEKQSNKLSLQFMDKNSGKLALFT